MKTRLCATASLLPLATGASSRNLAFAFKLSIVHVLALHIVRVLMMLIIFFAPSPPSSSSKQIKSETICKLYFNAKVRALYPVQMGRPINHCHGVFSYAHQCVIFYLAFTTLYHKCGIYIFLYRCLIILGMNTLTVLAIFASDCLLRALGSFGGGLVHNNALCRVRHQVSSQVLLKVILASPQASGLILQLLCSQASKICNMNF